MHSNFSDQDDTGVETALEMISTIQASQRESEIYAFDAKVLTILAERYGAQWSRPEEFTLRQILESLIEECALEPDSRLDEPYRRNSIFVA